MRIISLFVLSCLLWACSPALHGVSGSAVVTTSYPGAALTANAPLTLQGWGSRWVAVASESPLENPTSSMDFAMYSPTGEGPVTQHAHVLAARLYDGDLWRFDLENSLSAGAFNYSQFTGNDGRTWTMQLMAVPSAEDWFSAIWLENGRQVPETWLTARYTATPDTDLRLAAEYREPWPHCLDPDIVQTPANYAFVPRDCLKDFLDRAHNAFTASASPGEVQELRAPEASPLVITTGPLDTRHIIGTVRSREPLHLWPGLR